MPNVLSFAELRKVLAKTPGGRGRAGMRAAETPPTCGTSETSDGSPRGTDCASYTLRHARNESVGGCGRRAACVSPGAYGNTWFDTPHLNRFAAESTLWEWCYANSTDFEALYRTLWYALHPLRPAQASAGRESLARLAAERGYHTCLVTDENDLLGLPGAESFAEQITIPALPPALGADPFETATGRFFATAGETVRATVRRRATGALAPAILVVDAHARSSRTLGRAAELAPAVCDDEDPAPYGEVATPDFRLASDDPDIRFRYSAAYAAQVGVIDSCSGAFSRIAGCVDHWGTVGSPDGRTRLSAGRTWPGGRHRRKASGRTTACSVADPLSRGRRSAGTRAAAGGAGRHCQHGGPSLRGRTAGC